MFIIRQFAIYIYILHILTLSCVNNSISLKLDIVVVVVVLKYLKINYLVAPFIIHLLTWSGLQFTPKIQLMQE